MKRVFSVTETKAQFSKLLRRAAAGEEITITKWGVPVARLVPAEAQKGKRQLGFYEGKFTVPDEFDAPLPDEIFLTRLKAKRTCVGKRHESSAKHQPFIGKR